MKQSLYLLCVMITMAQMTVAQNDIIVFIPQWTAQA